MPQKNASLFCVLNGRKGGGGTPIIIFDRAVKKNSHPLNMILLLSFLAATSVFFSVRAAGRMLYGKPTYLPWPPPLKDEAPREPRTLAASTNAAELRADVIVVGSTLSSLVVAATLARCMGKRVYVFEASGSNGNAGEGGAAADNHDAARAPNGCGSLCVDPKFLPLLTAAAPNVQLIKETKECASLGLGSRNGDSVGAGGIQSLRVFRGRAWMGSLFRTFPAHRRELRALEKEITRGAWYYAWHMRLKLLWPSVRRWFEWADAEVQAWRWTAWFWPAQRRWSFRDFCSHTFYDLARRTCPRLMDTQVSARVLFGALYGDLAVDDEGPAIAECAHIANMRNGNFCIRGGVTSLITDLTRSIQSAGGEIFLGARVVGARRDVVVGGHRAVTATVACVPDSSEPRRLVRATANRLLDALGIWHAIELAPRKHGAERFLGGPCALPTWRPPCPTLRVTLAFDKSAADLRLPTHVVHHVGPSFPDARCAQRRWREQRPAGTECAPAVLTFPVRPAGGSADDSPAVVYVHLRKPDVPYDKAAVLERALDVLYTYAPNARAHIARVFVAERRTAAGRASFAEHGRWTTPGEEWFRPCHDAVMAGAFVTGTDVSGHPSAGLAVHAAYLTLCSMTGYSHEALLFGPSLLDAVDK